MEANKRLEELLIHLNLNQSEFAKKIGVSSGLINKIVAGTVAISETNTRLICLTFGVNEEWLRYGTGEMLNKERLSEHERRLLVLFQALSPLARRMLIEYGEKLVNDESMIRGNFWSDSAMQTATIINDEYQEVLKKTNTGTEG
jgi:transcriptional regulator with XRE-family HTH domain